MFFLLQPPFVSVASGDAEAVGLFCQAGIGIILAQENAVFRTRGEHTVRLVDPLCREVVNQHADIAFVPVHYERCFAGTKQGCIDPCNRTLSASLLVSCRAVYLSGKEQSVYDFRFQ